MNKICCDRTRKVFSNNFYHFIFHQIYEIYLYWHTVNFVPLTLYYNGPYADVVNQIPFLTLVTTDNIPQDCIEIVPKCQANTETVLKFSAYLQAVILPKIKIDYSNKISIVQRTKNRIIENINELKEALLPIRDVEIVTLEEHNFLRQIELLHSSKYIIMPHGANFTHLLFANAHHTTFIEIYPKYFKWRVYQGIAHKLNVPFKTIESILDLEEFYSGEILDFINSKKNTKGEFERSSLIEPINHKLRKYVRDVKYVNCNFNEILNFMQ